MAAILTAHHGRSVANRVIGAAVTIGVATAAHAIAAATVEAAAATEAAEAATEAATEARVTATAVRERAGVSDATSTATVAVHAPIETTIGRAMIEANEVHDDPRVAMMEAGDARARRAGASSLLDRPG